MKPETQPGLAADWTSQPGSIQTACHFSQIYFAIRILNSQPNEVKGNTEISYYAHLVFHGVVTWAANEEAKILLGCLEPETRVKGLPVHPISSLPKQFYHPFADFLDICIPVECVAKAQCFHKTQSSFQFHFWQIHLLSVSSQLLLLLDASIQLSAFSFCYAFQVGSSKLLLDLTTRQ